MSKGQTKKTREAAGNRRKLTRAEKKQIAEAIRKAKGDGKARTAQQTIPYLKGAAWGIPPRGRAVLLALKRGTDRRLQRGDLEAFP